MTKNTGREGSIIGVDIGGTKVAAGVISREGKILSQVRRPMVAQGDPEAALRAVASAIDALSKVPGTVPASREFEGIGLCAPGPLDPRAGIIINPPNLPCWRNYPLAAKIAAIYGVPVKLENDANAAALAETRWGAARGHRYVFYATIGTGIGTGIVLDGRIYHGHTGAAGEGGHVSIDYQGPLCYCGKHGCIEALASGPAIAARARARLAEDPSRQSLLRDLAQGKIEEITTETVGKAFAEGDPMARETLESTVVYLTAWLGNMVDLLDPDVIVIGGGVATILQPFFDEIRQRLPQSSVNPRASEIPLRSAHYGADAGIVGGAAVCT